MDILLLYELFISLNLWKKWRLLVLFCIVSLCNQSSSISCCWQLILHEIVLLFSTIIVMTSLVALSFYGASQLKFHYDKLLVGSVLSLVGALTLFCHHHDAGEFIRRAFA